MGHKTVQRCMYIYINESQQILNLTFTTFYSCPDDQTILNNYSRRNISAKSSLSEATIFNSMEIINCFIVTK